MNITQSYTPKNNNFSKKRFSSEKKFLREDIIMENSFCYDSSNIMTEENKKRFVSEIFRDDISTGCKTYNTHISSTKKKTVRPFGINGSNIGSSNKHSLNNLFSSPFLIPENINSNIRNVTIESYRPKKKVMSTEEMIMEKINKEKQELEKLKKLNNRNLEKLFSQTIQDNSSLFSRSSSVNILGRKREKDENKEERNSKKSADLINMLPNNLQNLGTKDCLERVFDEESLFLAEDEESEIPKPKSLFSGIPFLSFKENKEKERLKKREEKNKQIKKQMALRRVNLSLYEKNNTQYSHYPS